MNEACRGTETVSVERDNQAHHTFTSLLSGFKGQDFPRGARDSNKDALIGLGSDRGTLAHLIRPEKEVGGLVHVFDIAGGGWGRREKRWEYRRSSSSG